MITYDIRVLIGKDSTEPSIAVKCHDTGVRVRVYPEVSRQVSEWRTVREPYTIPDGVTAIWREAKPDGTYVTLDGAVEANAFALFDLSDAPQCFTAAGNARVEVSFYDANGKRLSSGAFVLEISEECTCKCDIESEGYVDLLGTQVKAANDAADRAEDAAEKAEQAAKRAEEAGGGGGGGVGADGGYYTPSVSQPSADTMSVSFTPSDSKMPSVSPVNITLPRGEKGVQGERGANGKDGADGKDGTNGVDGKDGYTPQKGVDYYTEADKAEIVDAVLAALPDGDEVSY